MRWNLSNQYYVCNAGKKFAICATVDAQSFSWRLTNCNQSCKVKVYLAAWLAEYFDYLGRATISLDRRPFKFAILHFLRAAPKSVMERIGSLFGSIMPV